MRVEICAVFGALIVAGCATKPMDVKTQWSAYQANLSPPLPAYIWLMLENSPTKLPNSEAFLVMASLVPTSTCAALLAGRGPSTVNAASGSVTKVAAMSRVGLNSCTQETRT
jgi:hypothetical protein